jgi:environmental stress-induced protein Ves
MQIIRQSSFKASPWKNGGGVTHEAIRVPAGAGSFRWRVSVAEIDASGPFSEFADYRRWMVLLRGAGLRLTFGGADGADGAGGGHAELNAVGDLVYFDGALRTHCELRGGPCMDLNLMVSKSKVRVRAWVERLQQPRALAGGTSLAFPISGALSLEHSDGAGGLRAWDLGVVEPRERVVVVPAAAAGFPGPLVFFAALDDNPP